ncbi:MAG: alpha/beta fold hydrolase [Isosphaeraceae bacterium]
MKNLATTLAWAAAAAFLGAAVMGFVPNPLLGPHALFVTNTAHNFVHLVTAIAFVVVALRGETASIRFMQAFGVVYLLTGAMGFVMLGSWAEGHLLYLVHINWLDNFLHVGLGIAIASAGWGLTALHESAGGSITGVASKLRGPLAMRAMPAVWASTVLVTSALISAPTAGFCEAREPDRRPAARVPAPRSEGPGLSPVRPYVRGKIPVVLIHGLWSSPRSWASMIEGLQADPILRENYQFWTFGYPTGEPVLYSASVLRRALLQARERYDPDGSDPAFDRMVLIGHSLGGLLAKLMAQDSRSRLWETVSARPADRLDGPAEARELLRRAFLFKPLPGVRRIIFIATPHRGSRLDRGAIHALGSRLIRHVDPLQRAYETVLASNGPDFFLDAFREGLPTSVDQLTWEHPRLLALGDLGIDPAVEYHSIIADHRDPPRDGGTDGVVPYASAHLDGAASELLVHGGHLCQDHPLVIRECRRILTEHLVRFATRPDGCRVGAPDYPGGAGSRGPTSTACRRSYSLSRARKEAM